MMAFSVAEGRTTWIAVRIARLIGVDQHRAAPNRSIEILGNVYWLDTGGRLGGGRFSFLDLATLLPERAEATGSPPRQTSRRWADFALPLR